MTKEHKTPTHKSSSSTEPEKKGADVIPEISTADFIRSVYDIAAVPESTTSPAPDGRPDPTTLGIFAAASELRRAAQFALETGKPLAVEEIDRIIEKFQGFLDASRKQQ